jgi:hypothetical protein
MNHFYLTLPSDSSGYYFPSNTIANFTTKLATPLELEAGVWEVGLVTISYPEGYKKRLLHNSIRTDSGQIIFPVKHYESVYDLLTNIPQFQEPQEKETFTGIFSHYINEYTTRDKSSKVLFNSCYGDSSIRIDDKVISYFPARVYNGLEDLAATIMNPANCHSFRITSKDSCTYAAPETIYVYTDIIEPNLVGDSYVRLLTTLHFPSSTGYHRFDYPLYKPVQQSFIESIAIRLVTKNGEDVLFEDSAIPSVVTLHFKKKLST